MAGGSSRFYGSCIRNFDERHGSREVDARCCFDTTQVIVAAPPVSKNKMNESGMDTLQQIVAWEAGVKDQILSYPLPAFPDGNGLAVKVSLHVKVSPGRALLLYRHSPEWGIRVPSWMIWPAKRALMYAPWGRCACLINFAAVLSSPT